MNGRDLKIWKNEVTVEPALKKHTVYKDLVLIYNVFL